MKHSLIKILIGFILVSGLTSGQNTVGLISASPQASSGFTLFAPNYSTETFLIDIEGRLVNKWSSDFTTGLTAYLLDNGNLLRSAQVDSTGLNRNGGFQLFSWDNDLLWEFYFGYQHHDIEPLPNGNVLMVVNDVKSAAEAIAAGRNPSLIGGTAINSLSILEISQTGLHSGTVVWEWRAWDHLIQDYSSTTANFGSVAQHPELIDINFVTDSGPDWLHTNSVAYNAHLDQIIISNRNTDEIWVIDHSTTTAEAAAHNGGHSGKGGDLLYRWGNPATYRAGTAKDHYLFGQHDARWIPDGLPGAGNITVFNNGFGIIVNPYSSAMEINPPADSSGHYSLTPGMAFEPVAPLWVYVAPDSFSFNSPRFGSVQRLPNGNTLVCAAESGIFFEVDTAGKTVWEYVNPVMRDGILTQGDTPIHNTVARCYRHDPDYLAFAGKDMTPGDPIELYLGLYDDRTNGHNRQILLATNYPNPFNPITTISYTLPQRSDVYITVYDLLGNEVITLVSDNQAAGYNSVQWDANNAVSGVYFYQIRAGEYVQTRKMVLLK